MVAKRFVIKHPDVRRLTPSDVIKLVLGDYTGRQYANGERQASWKALKRDLSALKPRRFLGVVRAALKKNHLVSVPLSICTNQYGFSYGQQGWHYWRDLAIQFMKEPGIPIEEMRFFKFFQRCQAPSFTHVMTLHNVGLRESLPEIPFGSYPWGISDSFSAIDPHRFHGVIGDRANQRFMWHEWGPDTKEVLRKEFAVTVRLLKSIQEQGYRPRILSRNSPFPQGLILVNLSGEVRFTQVSGAHRLAVLSALGHDRVIVQLDLARYPPILEEDVDSWLYVKSGLISRSAALDLFHLYFLIDGTERAEALGVLKGSEAVLK